MGAAQTALPAFARAWLDLMEQKDHFSWHDLAAGKLTRAQLLVHYQQEHGAYVRDFPVMLARVMGKGPPDDVRKALAENLYEEQTGGLSGVGPHPELFLQLMGGVGFKRKQILDAPLLPTTLAYRAFLDDATERQDWLVGYAVTCIFVEGSAKEGVALGLKKPTGKPPRDAEEAVAAHPLVKHYGVHPRHLKLTRAHFAVEGGHRMDAWRLAVRYARNAVEQRRVTEALQTALQLWHVYRDGVAAEMGLKRRPGR
ncbi:MAG: iron-containing redox enzyme family protein [Myxococcota bacterium]